MAERGAEIAIVGAGIVGASIAYHLALRGATNVVILEAADTPMTGSSARSLAGVRHQFSDAVNVRLSLYGAERIRNFSEEVAGDAGFHQVGYLLLHSDSAAWERARRDVELQLSLGAKVTTLAPGEVRTFIPDIRTDDLYGATFGPDDGYCDPHGIGSGYLARARAAGVQVRCATPVTGIRVAGGRVTAVETPSGPLACDIVVNAAGCWAGQVGALAGLEIPVKPYRRCVYMTEPFDDIPGDIPLTIDVASGFYMRKEQASIVFGVSNPNEPSSFNLEVDWDWLETVSLAGFHRFPILERARLVDRRCWAGLYEITPDHMPILGRHPDLPNYVDASGFSGHGVMHSPATGMLIAEEILDGRAATIDIDDLRVSRFAAGRPREERNIF